MRIDELNGELRSGDEILYGSSGSVVQSHLKFTPEVVEDDLLWARLRQRVQEQIMSLVDGAEITGDYVHIIVRAEGKKKDDDAGD